MTRTRSPGGRAGPCAQANPFVRFLSKGRSASRTMDNQQTTLRITYKYFKEVIFPVFKKTTFADEYHRTEAQNCLVALLSVVCCCCFYKYQISILRACWCCWFYWFGHKGWISTKLQRCGGWIIFCAFVELLQHNNVSVSFYEVWQQQQKYSNERTSSTLWITYLIDYVLI